MKGEKAQPCAVGPRVGPTGTQSERDRAVGGSGSGSFLKSLLLAAGLERRKLLWLFPACSSTHGNIFSFRIRCSPGRADRGPPGGVGNSSGKSRPIGPIYK